MTTLEDIVTLEELQHGLRIDKHDMDTCLIQQPQLFYRVSDLYARATADRDSYKVDIETAEAELFSQFRRQLLDEEEQDVEDNKKKGSRVTDTAIKSKVAASKRMIDLHRKYLNAKERADSLAALKEAYQQRSYVLKDLVALYVSNYFTTESGGKARNAAKDNSADRNREAAGRLNREARRERRGD